MINLVYLATGRVPTRSSRQRGVVLFIALIVMVAMSLAAIALMRSVDTTSAVIGNLAFRQASILPANYGIEDAAAGLFNDANPTLLARIPDVRVDTPAQNYYATHKSAGWDDQYGVPQPLQTKAAAAALTRSQADGAGNTVTYVTERMCNPDAPVAVIPADKSAERSWCDMLPPKQPPGATINDPSLSLDFRQVFYRITVRVDGPPGTNTVSFAQAMLR
jgi:type IV pilus assembly protein PilX